MIAEDNRVLDIYVEPLSCDRQEIPKRLLDLWVRTEEEAALRYTTGDQIRRAREVLAWQCHAWVIGAFEIPVLRTRQKPLTH